MAQDITFDIIARDKASSTFSKIGRSSGRASENLAKFGKAAALGLVGVGVAATAVGVKLAKMAAEDQVSSALMAKQFRNSAHATRTQIAATEDWISAQGRAKGIADDELRPALSSLVTATHNVRKAQRLTALAMDISAAKGKPLATVSLALTKAYNGNIGGLGRLGIKTKDAAGHTLKFAAAQKELVKQFGGAAATKAKTFQGVMDRFHVMLNETGEAIGYKLLPILTKAGNWFLSVGVPAISRFTSGLQSATGPGGRLSGVIQGARDAVGRLASALVNAYQTILPGLIKGFDSVKKSIHDNQGLFRVLGAALKAIGTVLVEKVIPAVAIFYSKYLPILGKAIGLAITTVRLLGDAWLLMAEAGLQGFKMLLSAAFGTFDAILTAADKALGWIPDIGKKIHKARLSFDGFRDGTGAALDTAIGKVQDLRKALDTIKPKSVKVTISSSIAKPVSPLFGPGITTTPTRRSSGAANQRTAGPLSAAPQFVIHNVYVQDMNDFLRQAQRRSKLAALSGGR